MYHDWWWVMMISCLKIVHDDLFYHDWWLFYDVPSKHEKQMVYMIYPFSHNSKLHSKKTPQARQSNSFKHGWLVGWMLTNQWTTAFSRMTEVRMWRMFLSGGIVTRTLSCLKERAMYVLVSNHTEKRVWFLQSHPRHGTSMYFHSSTILRMSPSTKKPWALWRTKEKNIYIYIYLTHLHSKFQKKTLEHFGRTLHPPRQKPDYRSMMLMV